MFLLKRRARRHALSVWGDQWVAGSSSCRRLAAARKCASAAAAAPCGSASTMAWYSAWCSWVASAEPLAKREAEFSQAVLRALANWLRKSRGRRRSIRFAGVGDGAVKLHVGEGSGFKVCALVVHFLQGPLHALQVARVTALGGNGGCLGFDPQAHFEHLREVRAPAVLFWKAEHRTGRGLRNKRAQATPGGQYAIGLELGNRLAHHRTADIQLFGQLLLGRQARLGRQLSGQSRPVWR